MNGEVVQFGVPSTTCQTCNYRRWDKVCNIYGYWVPDDFVCSEWKKKETILWKPGQNREGD